LSFGSSVIDSTPNIFGPTLARNGAWAIAPIAANCLSSCTSSVPVPNS